MTADRKKLYVISISILVILLFALLLPNEVGGRIIAAILLPPVATIAFFFVKKRTVLSKDSRQILLIITVFGIMYVTLYFISGLYFGFYSTSAGFTLDNILRFVLPISSIVISTEVLRFVFRAQESTLVDIISYMICTIADFMLRTNLRSFGTFSAFVDTIASIAFPAIVANLLYHYISKRYGVFPNISYRLLITLYVYIIPISSKIPDSLLAFVNLFIPLIIYTFIDTYYEKKKHFALTTKKRSLRILHTAITVVVIVAITGTAMLISNQFQYGALVIATDSMSGELDRGDAAIYEQYDGQIIATGQIIVFEKNDSVVVHRVIDIKNINGSNRYFTKGDINEEPDDGYITESQIVGVVNLKVPFVGYPTLWLRKLFLR